MALTRSRLLILCKTYPSPSAAYVETSCVAAMDADGKLVRLYPVPFRLMKDQNQFRKWQWVSAEIEKAPRDHRAESHRIRVDTIAPDGDPIPTQDGWRKRRDQLAKLETFRSFTELERARRERGVTLGLLCPPRIVGLEIEAAREPDWTEDERTKLLQSQIQGDLFADAEERELRTLRKMPFDFYYRYEDPLSTTAPTQRHKVVDWEVGALYWKVERSEGARWQRSVRAKLESELLSRDLLFLMGTIHRFPDQWLIVSLIYPPKQQHENQRQFPFQ
jgi:hypothetical protein